MLFETKELRTHIVWLDISIFERCKLALCWVYTHSGLGGAQHLCIIFLMFSPYWLIWMLSRSLALQQSRFRCCFFFVLTISLSVLTLNDVLGKIVQNTTLQISSEKMRWDVVAVSSKNCQITLLCVVSWFKGSGWRSWIGGESGSRPLPNSWWCWADIFAFISFFSFFLHQVDLWSLGGAADHAPTAKRQLQEDA